MKELIIGKALDKQMNWEELTEYTAQRIAQANPKNFNKQDFIQWMLKREGRGYLFDHILIYQAYRITQKLKSNDDYFLVISGVEGRGKSLLAIQICSWVDLTFKVDDICFNSEQYISQLGKHKPNKAVLLDEAGLDLFSRQAMTKGNIDLVKLFMVMRQLRLFTCLCLPNFHLLDSYIKDHRVDTLIQIKDRGRYIAMHGASIKKVIKDGAKSKQVLGIKLPIGYFWDGSWRNLFPHDMSYENYLEKKSKHVKDFINVIQEKSAYVKLAEVARRIGVSSLTMKRRIKKGNIEYKMIGNNYFLPRNIAETLEREGFS